MLVSERRSLRIAALAIVLGIVALLVPASASGRAGGGRQIQEKSWDIERIDEDITINPDSSFTVSEKVVANFHGSFSFLNHPISTQTASFTGGKTYGGVRVKNIKVYDANGNPAEGVKIEKSSDGPVVRLSFSATNEQRTWIYQYDYRGAIIFGPEADRLYYNAIGSERDVPVKQSRVTVHFPEGTDMEKVEYTFYDIPGAAPDSIKSGKEGNTVWYTTGEIPPYAPFTIDVQFPKGVVSPPPLYTEWFLTLMIVLGCVLAVGILGLMLWMWWSRGRDVGRPGLDVVRYEPPSDLKPAMVGVLVNETAVDSDISATIVDLAIRGKLIIGQYEKPGIFKDKTEFGFDRTGADESDLTRYESDIMAGLFESGSSVRESDLEDKFYVHLGGIYLDMKDEVLSRGLFDGDPAKVKGRYALIGAAAAIIGLFIALFVVRWLDLGYFNVLAYSLVPCAIVVFVVGRYMPRRTAKGSEALSYVMGFKEYMSTAEKGELEWMTPENFQANLPYAVALGVTDKWAEKFEDIYVTPPDWYRGTYATGFSAVYLADSLSHMQDSMSGTMASSPSSSGSGGGGFGGGSSGGGFGGGGFSAG
ncbi:MAG: DUF2207 domain-containing protein [Actinomycetota bacterium]